jgi:sporulation protein YlmC with PRC-barrel domain
MTMLVGFHLLDRQVIDRDGLLVGKVDDVELSDEDPPRVVALLLGPQALGERMGGWLGGYIADLARRLHPASAPVPTRIAYEQVSRVDSAVRLRIPRTDLPEPSLEVWLRTHIVDRVPGADRAGA